MTMPTISREAVLPISLGLLFGLTVGIFTLALKVSEFTNRLSSLEGKVTSRWTYNMEKESWFYFQRANPEVKIPDVSEIRNDNIY